MKKQTPEIAKPQMETLIEEWVYPKRDKEIVKARLLEGMYFKEISTQFHLCERQVKTIVYKYQKIIYKMAEKLS